MTLLVVLAMVVPALHTDTTPLSCDGKPVGFHLHRAHALVERAFDQGRFLDATPATAGERRRWRAHKHCVLDPQRRHRIARAVDRAKRKFAAYFEALLYPPGRATLEAIGQCESGGNPHAVSSNGTYRGKYQFDSHTWASVGGAGDPAAAPEREQDYRAAVLYQRAGSKPWPVCGR